MGEAAYEQQVQADHNVEVVLHVDEALGEAQRNDLVDALEGTRGIQSAEFCPLRYHLLLVDYDREALTSQDVLARVTSESVHAELIGPM